MACTAVCHLSMNLGERQGKGAPEPEALLILAHFSLFFIQLIKAMISLTQTPSGNDECAAEEAELGTLYTVQYVWLWMERQKSLKEVGGVVRGTEGEVKNEACLFVQHLSTTKLFQKLCLRQKASKQHMKET